MFSISARKSIQIVKEARDEEAFAVRQAGTEGSIEDTLDQCHLCKHWVRGTLTCNAFPEGVPLGFFTGDYDHTSPYPGDNGLLFAPID